MNKIERMNAVLRNEIPDRTPAGFWHHYPGSDSVEQMAENHLSLYRTTDMDIIKVMQDYPYPLSGQLQSTADWYKIRFPGKSSPEYQKMEEVLKRIVDGISGEAMIFQTMFGPFKAAVMAYGNEAVMAHARQDPKAVAAGVRIIAEGMAEWVDGYLGAGASGIYFSAQFGEVGRFSREEWSDMVRTTDLLVLNAVRAHDGKFSILHICGEPEYSFETHLDRYGDYPADLFNWSVKDNHYSLERGRDFFQKPILGGMNNKGFILNGTEEQIRNEVQEIIRKFGRRGLMIGADCTIQGKGIDPLKLRTAVEAAHQFTE